MAERTNIPTFSACGQWETLLAEALDGLLKPADEAIFTAHMSVCPACAALFEDARRGREWLEFLSPEPEVPAGLLDKILAHTGPGQAESLGLTAGAVNVLPMPPVWQRPGMMGRVVGQARRFAEPNLLMTAAMAFFTIALTLNLTGVRLNGFRLADLRPTAVRSFMERRITMASTPIVRYYDHLRFVREVESTVRQLRRTTESEDNQQRPRDTAPGESKQNPVRKDGNRMNAPQQSRIPALRNSPDSSDSFDSTDFLETSQTLTSPTFQPRSAHSRVSAMAVWERSTAWTA